MAANERERPAHLWKPGQSGNPGGRKPGPNPLAVLRALLDEPEEPGATRSKLEAFWAQVFSDAMYGREGVRSAAQKLIADRIAPLKLVLEGSEDGVPVVRLFTSGPKVIEAEKVEEKG